MQHSGDRDELKKKKKVRKIDWCEGRGDYLQDVLDEPELALDRVAEEEQQHDTECDEWMHRERYLFDPLEGWNDWGQLWEQEEGHAADQKHAEHWCCLEVVVSDM